MLSGVYGALSDIKSHPTLNTGLRTYYPMDEKTGTIITDVLGINNGNNTGVIYLPNGKIEGAYNYTSAPSTSKLPTSNLVVGTTTATSIGFWIRTTSTENKQIIGNYNGGGYVDGEWEIRMNDVAYGSGSILIGTNVNGTSNQISFNSGLNDGNWHYVLIVVNSSESSPNKFKLYKDNVEITTKSGTQSISGNIFGLSQNIHLASTAVPDDYINITLDELGIWNRPLTTSEITDLYNSGAGLPYDSSTKYFSIGAKSNYTNAGLTTFNASVTTSSGTTEYATTTGQINTTVTANFSELVNITITAPDRFSKTYIDYNVSTNLNASLIQSDIKFQARQKVTGEVIPANFSIGTTILENGTSIYLDAGSYNYTAYSPGYLVSMPGTTYSTSGFTNVQNVFDYNSTTTSVYDATNTRTRDSIGKNQTGMFGSYFYVKALGQTPGTGSSSKSIYLDCFNGTDFNNIKTLATATGDVSYDGYVLVNTTMCNVFAVSISYTGSSIRKASTISTFDYYTFGNTASITALQNETLTIYNLSNNVLTLNLLLQNVTVGLSTWNATITNAQYGFSETIIGTSGVPSVIANLTQNLTYNVTVQANNFRTASVLVTPNASTFTQTVSLIQSGYTNLTLRAIDANTFNTIQVNTSQTNVTVAIDRFTSTQTYILPNGTTSILVPELLGQIRFLYQAGGYDNNAVDINFGTVSPQYYNLTAQMINSSNPFVSSVAFSIVSTGGTPIQGAQLSMYVQQNGSTALYTQRYTDISGIATVSVDTRTIYLINISATGYADSVFYLQPTATSYTITLTGLAGFDFSDGYADVIYAYSPTNISLLPVNISFSYNISGPDNFIGTSVALYNGTDLLYSDTSTNPNGTQYAFPFDVSPYMGGTLTMVMSYTIDGKDPSYIYKGYLIRNVSTYSGGIDEFRTYATGNLSVANRFIIWVFITLLLSLLIALFVRGIMISLVAITILGYFGYMLGFSIWLIIPFCSLLIAAFFKGFGSEAQE
jgi:hypothetical protein